MEQAVNSNPNKHLCTAYLQEDDGVVAGVLHEELLEVCGAGREDHLVALNRRPVAGDGHVAECLGLQGRNAYVG